MLKIPQPVVLAVLAIHGLDEWFTFLPVSTSKGASPMSLGASKIAEFVEPFTKLIFIV
jgi:hypothetical protein